jgi:hypothetical protein
MALPRTSAPFEVRLVAIGVPVTVVCEGSRAVELQRAVRAAWRDCLDLPTDPAVASATVRCRLDHSALDDVVPGHVQGSSLPMVLDRLSPAITETAIRAQTGRLLMLHACGLADPSTGSTLVFAATSGTGKTTLVRTLGDELAYVTDETVAIRRDGTVVAYPKPLSVLEKSTQSYKVQTPASTVGLSPWGSAARLAGLVVMRREPGTKRVEVEAVSTLPALAELAPHGSLLGELDHPLAWMADLLQAGGGLRRIIYAEADTLRPVVRDLLASPT